MKSEISKGFFVAIGFLIALFVWSLATGLLGRMHG